MIHPAFIPQPEKREENRLYLPLEEEYPNYRPAQTEPNPETERGVWKLPLREETDNTITGFQF